MQLAPPLRRFEPRDADTVALLNDMASHGLVLTVWQEMRQPGETVWEVGRRRTLARMQRSDLEMIVVDEGTGTEAVLMCNPIPLEPQDASDEVEVFRVLVELENLALGSWYINVLATLPEHRGKGHGSRLIDCAGDFARSRGHDAVSLIASDANPEALRLYERHGFRVRDRRPMVKGTWDGPGKDWLLYVKPL